MASFASVPDAVSVRIAIQKAFTAYNLEHPETPLYLRIGLSAGEPIEEHGDLLARQSNWRRAFARTLNLRGF